MHRRDGGPGRRRDRRAWRRPGSTPTATRWSVRCWPSGTSTSPSRTRRACAARSATRRRTRPSAAAPNEAMATLGEVAADADPDLRPRDPGRARRRSGRPGTTSTASPTSPAAGCPGNVPRALPDGARRSARPVALADAVGHAPVRRARRAGRRGAAGDVQRRPRDGRGACRRRRSRPRSSAFAAHGDPADARRRGRRRAGARAARATSRGRSRVPREPRRADRGRRLGRRVEPAGAARPPRPGRARRRRSSSSSPTGPARRSTGRRSRGSRRRSSRAATTRRWPRRSPRSAPTSSCSPATCGSSGRAVLAAFGGRILNTHPSLLPAFPGAHAVARRPRPRRDRDRLHRPPRRRDARRRPDRRPGGGRDPARRRRGDASTSGSRPSSTGCCRGRSRSLARRRASRVAPDGRRVTIDIDRADAAIPTPAPGAAVGLGQDRAGRPFGARPGRARVRARLDRRDGAGAARRRPARDRRRRRDRVPRDARRPGQDPPPAGPRRASSPIGASPTIAASSSRPRSRRSSSSSSTSIRSRPPRERPGITLDELVEEIDIGGPSMVRAAAKNHANVAIVTSPARYDAILAALDERRRRSRHGAARARWRSRRSATPPRTTPGSPRRCPRGWPRPASRCPTSRACPAPRTRIPPSLTVGAREGRDAPLRREPAPAGGPLPARRGATAADGPFATGEPPLQGKALSLQQRPRRGGRGRARPSAARPGLRDRQAHEPVRRRGAGDARSRRGRRRSPATRSRRSVGSWR